MSTNAHFPYEKGNIFNKDPRRPRRLLMHKQEINRLYGKVKQDGYALIPPVRLFKHARVKVAVGLCKGKKLYDKRQAAAERDARRQIDRAMKERYDAMNPMGHHRDGKRRCDYRRTVSRSGAPVGV